MDRIKKLVRFLLGIPLTVVTFYFIGLFIWNSRDSLFTSLAHANYILLIVGILFFIAFFFLKNIIWFKILKNLGAKDIDTSKSFFLLSFSETKRYIPGSIFAFVSRVQSFKEANIPTPLLIKSLVIESLLLMIPSMLISIPGLIFIYPRLYKEFPQFSEYILPAVIIGIIGALGIVVIASIVAKKKLGVKKITFSSLFGYLDLALLSALSWVFFGVGNYLVASAIHVLDPRYMLEFSSFFVLSWFIGYISVVTPMGLGVREGIMVIGLAPFAPLNITSLIAVFSRIIFMAGEFIFLFLSYILYKSAFVQRVWKNAIRNWQAVVLWMSIGIYALYFSYVSIIKYLNFFMGKFDLGNMDQTVWNSLHGRIFQFTNPDAAENISRLAFHADFILIFFSPLYLLWSDPRVLLIIQTIILSLGAYFVYKIAQYVIKNNTLSLILGICYLLNPLVQKQNLYDFHAVVLATTFLLAVWYFLISKRFIWMGIFLVLAVLTKENVYLITALIGGYLIYKRHIKIGLVVMTLSLVTFYALMKYLIPGARAGGEHFALQFLSEFGDSLGSAGVAIITNPFRTFQIIWDHNGLEYLKMIFISQGFLSLGSPLLMIFPSFDIVKNLLASNPNFRQSYYQYNAEILPFIFISTIYTIRYLLKKIPANFIAYYLLFFAVVGLWNYGALPFGKQPYVDIYTKPRVHAEEIREFLQTIPDDASVSATNNLGSHLSRRQHIYVLPNGIEKSDYVLFLNTDWYDPVDELNMKVETLKKDKSYSVVYQKGSFTAFKKVYNH
jgi:uncharacterized membrane protein